MKIKNKFLILTITTMFILSSISFTYAGLFSGGDLTSKISDALSEIQSWIVKIATPAAAVAIGSGLLMKKFSFGDEEKIATGRKLIRNTIFSYTFILLIDPVISALQGLFG